MSQADGKRGRAGGNGTHVLAVLHAQGQHLRLVVVRCKPSWEVLLARTLDGAEAGTLEALCREHGVGKVVRITPASQTVARCAALPPGDDGSLGAAAALLAEAQLPSSLPPHRRCAGVLPEASGTEVRTALLTGWTVLDAPQPAGRHEEVWVTPVAALAAVQNGAGRAAVYTEPEQGAICLLMRGPQSSVARVLVEESRGGWTEQVGAAAAETAQLAGLTTGGLSGLRLAEPRRLLIEPATASSLRTRVAGVRDDVRWMDEYGLAVGAALVAGSDSPTVRSLAGLFALPPQAQRSPVERLTEWVAQPRNAAGLLAAACALLLIAPMGFAWARMEVLESRVKRVEGLKVGREGLEQKAAMYQQLEVSRWPMTKLLADVSGATPVGVVVTNLQLSTGQGVTVQGTAETSEQITKLEANLNATRLFTNVSVNRVDTRGGDGFEFDLSARVYQPHVAAKPVEDFASKPLAVRMFGEGASNTTAPSSSSDDPPRRGTRRPAPDDADDNAPRERPAADSARRPSGTSTPEVPPPLTNEQIGSMDRGTAMKEWATRKTASGRTGIDASVKQRLLEEVPKLKARMDQTKDAAAAPPGGGA
jgi:Tfp pilus assembly protein PilN